VEEREENPAQEDGTSNRLLSPTFIPPLTAWPVSRVSRVSRADSGHLNSHPAEVGGRSGGTSMKYRTTGASSCSWSCPKCDRPMALRPARAGGKRGMTPSQGCGSLLHTWHRDQPQCRVRATTAPAPAEVAKPVRLRFSGSQDLGSPRGRPHFAVPASRTP
jgi:hypothetical protein